MGRVNRALMRQAYDEVKRRIITLELAPGHRLDDIELAAAMRLSRTPVREALFLLASEGLIEMGNRGGFTVRALDLTDIADLFEVHVVAAKAVARLAASRATEADLEAMAAAAGAVESAIDRPRLAASRATEADLEAMAAAAGAVESAIDRRDHLAITQSNAELHRLEAAATHNRHLQLMANKIHDHGERLAYLCFGGDREWADQDDYFAKVKQDHAALLEAYRAHDAGAAEQLATDHVRQFLERVQSWLASEATTDFVLTDRDLSAGDTLTASVSRPPT